MRTHQLERFGPRHAGETACKGDSATQRSAVQFNWVHRMHSRSPQERLTLPTRLLLSRPASARTRCGGLLFLSIHTGTKSFHQIDHARRRSLPSGFDLLASLFLLQEIDQSVFVAILELRWVKVTRLRLYDVGSQIEHFLREL